MAASRIARAAGIIMVGSVLSRVLGMGREAVISDLFGSGAAVDAFRVASQLVIIIYDLLISGMVSAALVPVLSEYTSEEPRAEMGRILGIIITGALVVLGTSVVLLEIFVEPLVDLVVPPNTPAQTHELALHLTQIVLPSVLFMGISAIFMSALYALHRFTFTSLAMSALNAAIIGAGVGLSGLLHVQSLVIGTLLGSILMVVIQWPGVRDIPIRLSFDFRHPAVRRILVLYGPIALSLVVSQAALLLDRRFALEIGEGNVAAMSYATTLIQFALGIVGAAISLAALPSLSQHFASGDDAAYRRTLGVGWRLVTVLVVPAAAGLAVLGLPLITLVFQHGHFTAADRWPTLIALLCYVLGLPAAALNQVLIFGFYSRKNTKTPVTVGIVGVGVYIVVALLLKGPLGMAGLVLANSAQLTFNAVVTGVLLWRSLGGLRGESLGATTLKAAVSAALMAGLSFLAWGLLAPALPDTLIGHILALGLPAALGVVIYGALLAVLRVRELDLVRDRLLRRLPGRAPAPDSVPPDAAPAFEMVLDDEAAALGAENPAAGLEIRLVETSGGPGRP